MNFWKVFRGYCKIGLGIVGLFAAYLVLVNWLLSVVNYVFGASVESIVNILAVVVGVVVFVCGAIAFVETYVD